MYATHNYTKVMILNTIFLYSEKKQTHFLPAYLACVNVTVLLFSDFYQTVDGAPKVCDGYDTKHRDNFFWTKNVNFSYLTCLETHFGEWNPKNP